ncbi:COG4705 family protein [Psychrobacter cryohalolentis]|uniref:Membrane-anchored protein n=1 Tax=Psychrobacter cryohalolentis (strain ATCC BAA-1226 / DSM 17306 / VKM B-2378 / K5) TaxID=335284 RepID=Q1Q9K0_PSYCK|nr:membrane protein [Psychrobacter cryohalolentis]ABE75653.1 protein of unknown function DUF347 [Psychrobacter cryohalolentis K5]
MDKLILDNHMATVKQALVKVPEVTLLFWIIKVAATTLGETAGDALSMSLNLGYIVSTAIFAVIFAVAVATQIKAKQFNKWLYWGTIVATTTLGTTIADFVDRSLGIGYAGGTSLLFAMLIVCLVVWRKTMGSISVDSIVSSKAEMFYWTTIMFSQTLGTALGDWVADSKGMGYTTSAIIFGSLLAIIAGAYFWTNISRTLLFWSAFILTRPLGAVLGDFLDKPIDHGGLALSRFGASAVLLVFIIFCLVVFKHRASAKSH